MEPKVEVVEPKLFAGAVADEIVASIQEAINERGRCSLVLAGGRTPGAIYRFLGLPPRVEDIEWEKLDLFWGDERWVPSDDSQSNYRMVCETLLGNVPSPGPKVHAVRVNESSPDAAAAKYGDEIKRVMGSSTPQFDIVLLGVGEDGHTASIFPGSPTVRLKDTLCVAVPHPDGGQRITLSPTALFSARKIFFIVNGERKAGMLRKIFDREGSVEQIPARLHEQAAGAVTWFVDSEAARKLALHS